MNTIEKLKAAAEAYAAGRNGFRFGEPIDGLRIVGIFKRSMA